MSSRKGKDGKPPLKPEPAKRKAADAANVDANGWPAGYVESFVGLPGDFERPPQGKLEEREKFD
jgi:hypothetical protein